MKANLASLCYSKEVVLYPKQWRVVNHGRIIYSPWVIKFNFRRTKACAVWLGCCSEEEKLQPKVHTYFPYRVIHSHRLVVLYVSLFVCTVRRKTKKENNDSARGCRTFAICFNEMTTAAVYVIWTFKKIRNFQKWQSVKSSNKHVIQYFLYTWNTLINHTMPNFKSKYILERLYIFVTWCSFLYHFFCNSTYKY